jgi:hypothetical protein
MILRINEPEVKNRNQSQEIKRIDQVYDMVKSMMAKLDTLDEIKRTHSCVERDVGHMTKSNLLMQNYGN